MKLRFVRKNVAVFRLYSVRFCGFRPSLTPPSRGINTRLNISLSPVPLTAQEYIILSDKRSAHINSPKQTEKQLCAKPTRWFTEDGTVGWRVNKTQCPELVLAHRQQKWPKISVAIIMTSSHATHPQLPAGRHGRIARTQHTDLQSSPTLQRSRFRYIHRTVVLFLFCFV